MSKSKKALVNTTVVALIIIVYQLLPKNIDFSFLPIGMASFLGYAVYILGYVFSFVYTLVLYSVLILVWGKSKYLLEKPLFDKSLPFAKRFNIGKLVILFVADFLLDAVIGIVGGIVTNFVVISIIDSVWVVLQWLVFYFMIMGRGHSIVKKPKYTLAWCLIILPVTAVCTIIVSYIATQTQSIDQMNMFGVLEMLSYSERIGNVDFVLSIIVTLTLVFFHTLSVPEEVPLETSNKSAELTE